MLNLTKPAPKSPMQKARRTSVRKRLMLLVSGSVLVSALPVATLFGIEEANRHARSRWSEMKTAADVLASSVVEAVQTNDAARAFQAIRAVSQSPGVVYARVRTSTRATLAENGSGVRLRHDVRIKAGEANPKTWDLITTQSIEVTAPVLVQGRKIGEVVVVHKATGIAGQIARSVLSVLGLAMLAMLLALLVAQRVQAALTRPLVNLTKSVGSIAADNDFSRRVDVVSDDEVGDLVAGFNAMLEAIQVRDGRIDAQMRGLEAEVAARTADYLDARDEAQAASAAKSDFLATMSHEIRTPMNGVMVMAELLTGESLPAKARRYADTIAKSGRSLLAVINDILDFSKIEAGKMDVEICPVDIVALIDDTLALFGAKAAEKGLELVALIHPDAPRLVPADPVRLGQILSNLVSNALKFTETGHVLVRLESEPEGQGWRLIVVDTGLGIASDKLGSIFGAFSQEDQTTTRKFGGTGLGLSISKRLTEAMGGAIAVTSTQGKGSAFHVRLPCFEDSIHGASKAGPPDLAGMDPARIGLVCIDAPVEAAALARRLRASGMLLNGPDTDEAKPDLVVTDKANHASSLERFGATNLVLVCDPGDAQGEQLLAQGQVIAVIDRPFRHDQLDAVLSRLANDEPLSDPDANKVSGHANAAKYAFPRARILVVDDSEVNREIALEALSRFEVLATTANDGQEALDVLAVRDFDLVLMDGSMPVLDGFEATKRLRALEAEAGKAPTPVVALTAFVVGPAADAWRGAGMNGVLHKPFTLAALGEVLATNLPPDLHDLPSQVAENDAALHVVDQHTGSPASPSVPGGERTDLFDEAVAGPLFAGLNTGRADFVMRVTGLYKDHGPRAISEIEAAFSARDIEELAKAAHSLKSMSLNIGAKAVARQASAIEGAARDPAAASISSEQINEIGQSLRATLAAIALRLGQNSKAEPEAKPAQEVASAKTTAAPPQIILPRIQNDATFDQKLAEELEIDILAGALEMVYQPLFDRLGTTIVSAEALVRWKRGERAPIGPDVFVPLAERSGLITDLGAAARRLVFERTASWNLPIAVNVSPLELVEEDFVTSLDALLAKTGFSPKNLVLEVTETAFIGEPDRILALFHALKARGIALSLDDFGAGYSSLTSLHRFPFDKIKIDREFVSALDGEKRASLEALAIIQAVTGIGRALGREVVAEGVETEAQHIALKSAGVHTMQGYLFSRPVSGDTLAERLSKPLARAG